MQALHSSVFFHSPTSQCSLAESGNSSLRDPSSSPISPPLVRCTESSFSNFTLFLAFFRIKHSVYLVYSYWSLFFLFPI